KSRLAHDIARLGRVCHENLNIFNIETTLNNQMFDPSLGFLMKNEDELTRKEHALLRGLVAATKRLPQPLRHTLFDKFPAPYGVTGVWAGNVAEVHEKVLERSFQQYMVPFEGQVDVLVCPIPFISPYNVHAFLNPLLVQVLAQGYLFNMY